MKIFGLNNASKLSYANHEVTTQHPMKLIVRLPVSHEEKEVQGLKTTFPRTQSLHIVNSLSAISASLTDAN